jgi:hypothetical protein
MFPLAGKKDIPSNAVVALKPPEVIAITPEVICSSI